MKPITEQPNIHQEFISNTEILLREITFSGMNYSVSVKSGYPDDTMKILRELALELLQKIKEEK